MTTPVENRRYRGGVSRRQRMLSGVMACSLVVMAVATALVGRPQESAAQSTSLDTAAFAPESALLYAAVNLDQTTDQYTQANALLERAGLSSLLEQTVDDQVGGEETAADVEAVLGGEVGVVVTSLAGADSLDFGSVVAGDVQAVAASAASGFGVVLRAGDPDAAYSFLDEELTKTASESSVDVAIDEYEGVEISSVVAPDSDDDAGSSISLARVDDYILIAEAADDLEPMIDAQAGNVPSLAESDTLSELQGRLNPDYLMFAFINGPALKTIVSNATDSQTETLIGDAALSALDAYTGLVVWADDPGFRLDTISLPTDEGRVSTLMGNFDGTLDERVPSDTMLFVDGQGLGESGLLNGLALLFAMGATGMVSASGDSVATPEAVNPNDVLEQASQLLGFNLQTEFIDQLTGEFGLALSVTSLFGPDGIGAIFVSGVDDPSVLQDSISKIALLIAAAVSGDTEYSTREVSDATVNVVENTSGSLPVHVEYGVVDGELLVGYGSGLQTYVDGLADSLASNPQYQDVMALLPEEHGAVFYLDLAQIVGLVETLFGSMGGGAGITDASDECASYETQAEAQTAYDEDSSSLIDLDLDFDGDACEDYFVSDATPVAEGASTGFAAITALATVSFEDDGATGTSTILYIAP